jgi:hypothetical protein
MASAVNSPVVKLPLALPLGAPVLRPPWSRQRFRSRIAGHWQGVPARFRAPHRGLHADSLAVSLPLGSWGCSLVSGSPGSFILRKDRTDRLRLQFSELSGLLARSIFLSDLSGADISSASHLRDLALPDHFQQAGYRSSSCSWCQLPTSTLWATSPRTHCSARGGPARVRRTPRCRRRRPGRSSGSKLDRISARFRYPRCRGHAREALPFQIFSIAPGSNRRRR